MSQTSLDIRILFSFFVGSVLAAKFAILREFQTVFQDFFILVGEIIDPFALGTLHFDHVILRHKFFNKTRKQTLGLLFWLYRVASV